MTSHTRGSAHCHTRIGTRRTRLAAFLVGAALVGASAVPAGAVPDTYWDSPGDGMFHNELNWSGGIVPDSNTRAVFGNLTAGSSYWVWFGSPATTHSVLIDSQNEVTFNLGGHEYSTTGSGWGLEVASYSNLTIRDGTLRTNEARFGDWGGQPDANCMIDSGGTLDVIGWAEFHGDITVSSGATLIVSETANLDGTTTIAGQVDIGSSAYFDGNCTIDSGGTLVVQEEASFDEALTVSGGGSTLSSYGQFRVGDWATGEGSLEAASGGQVSLQGTAEMYGNVTVDGADSNLSASGYVRVGRWEMGDGSLSVTGGGSVSMADFEMNGSLVVDGNNSSFTSTGWAQIRGGALAITGGGQVVASDLELWDSDGACRIDGNGSSLTCTDELGIDGGTLEITNGGQVVIDELWLEEGDGTSRIDGNASSLTAAGWVDMEGGALEITNGGYLSSDAAGINYGATISITGSGSTWDSNGFELDEGAELSVGPGAALNVTGNMNVFGSEVSLAAGAACRVGGQLSIIFGRLNTDNAVMETESVRLLGGELVGAGVVSGSFIGDSSSNVTALGGDLELGDPNRYDGFTMDGVIEVGGNTLTLNSQSFAAIGVLTSIGGGKLAAANGVYLQGGGTISGQGSVDGAVAAATGSTISATGNLTLGDSDRYDGFVSDGLLHVNSHTVTLNDRNEAVLGALTTLAGGTLAAPNGLLLRGGDNITGYGLVTADLTTQGYVHGEGPDPNDDLDLSGYVTGYGDFGGNVVFSGTYDPGGSPAAVDMGNAAFVACAALIVELGGLTPGGEHDQLNVANLVKLAGELQIELIGGFTPSLGDSFVIMTYGDHSGQFDSVVGIDLGDGLSLELSYGANALTILTVPAHEPGDVNGDGNMDTLDISPFVAALLAVDEDAFETGYPDYEYWAGDVNEDGNVDTLDITPFVNILTGGGSEVPEPATMVLLTLGSYLAVFRRKATQPARGPRR